MLKTALMLVAGALTPAFQAAPGCQTRPLLWETPVSWAAPRQAASPGLDFDPQTAAKIAEARKISRDSGPAAAAAHLAQVKSPELLLLRAGLKRQAGQMAAAQADYELVLKSDNRTGPRALALSGLKNVLRERIAAGEKQLYGRLIQSLKEEWRNEEALALLPSILADPDVSAEIKTFVRSQEPIMALRLGRYEEAARLWASPKTRSDTQWLAQTELRRGNFLRAAELRQSLAAQAKGQSRHHELSTAFHILAKGGLLAESKALADKHPEIKNLPDYGWRFGLAALAGNDLKAAEESFKSVLAKASLKSRHQGARYFLARTLEAAGRGEEAKAFYQEAAKGNSADYYRLLSLGRLSPATERSRYLNPPLLILLQPGPSGLDHDSLGFHLWLSEKGLSREEMDKTAAALARKSKILSPDRGGLNPRIEALLLKLDYRGLFDLIRRNETAIRSAAPELKSLWLPLAASVAARGGDYRLAVSLMSRIPGDDSKGPKKWNHPLIYGTEVLRAEREHSLSPSLLLALIRTESAYQADIMSASNARGLMQLLPATANKVAARLGEPEPGAMALFDPVLNIRYGSWYLKALIDGFGNEALALAGYNGGPYNIKSMILAKKGMPLDVFVECLPFEETANYVKRITESRYIYEMAYLGQASLPDLTGPVSAPDDSLPDF